MSGTLDIDEFEKLWRLVNAWSKVFRQFDINEDNRIDGSEMRVCMRQVGMGHHSQQFYTHIFGRQRRHVPIGLAIVFIHIRTLIE